MRSERVLNDEVVDRYRVIKSAMFIFVFRGGTGRKYRPIPWVRLLDRSVNDVNVDLDCAGSVFDYDRHIFVLSFHIFYFFTAARSMALLARGL